MRRGRGVPLAGALILVLFAGCKVEHEELAADAAAADGYSEDTTPGPDDTSVPDAEATHCTLFDGTDPVAFCTQKTILLAMHEAAFKATGIAESWNATTDRADTDDAGVVLHDWHDDVAYGAACALYHANAALYGDTVLTATLDADLIALGPLLVKELTPLPTEYTGETYQRLRVAGLGLNTANDIMDSQSALAIADAYGEAIYSKYFFHLASSTLDGGVTDAGSGDAGVDGGPDGSTGADAAAPIPGGVIGVPRGGAYAYVTADVATASYALLDLASRYPSNTNSANWQRAAESALEHIYERARDPATGLYYTALVTSNDPGHDALDPTVATAGTLLSDTAMTVALALSRAQDLVNTTPSLAVVASYPFSLHVTELLVALNGPKSLYDGDSPLDASATGTGFVEGYTPATQSFVTSKATRPNAYALAVLHRQSVMAGTLYATEIPPVRETLINPGPPMNGSLFSVVLKQDAYLRACTRTFEPLPAATEPHPDSYQTQAIVAVVEGLTEQLYGSR